MTGTRSLFSAGRAACLAATVATAALRADAQEAVRTGGLAPEPAIISRAIDYANRTLGGGSEDGDKSGLYPEFSNMPTGSGWISAGPGYRY